MHANSTVQRNADVYRFTINLEQHHRKNLTYLISCGENRIEELFSSHVSVGSV